MCIRDSHQSDRGHRLLAARSAGADQRGEGLGMQREQTPFQRIVADFSQSKLALSGLAVLALILLVAVFAPLISPQNPYDLAQLDVLDSRLPPGPSRATA